MRVQSLLIVGLYAVLFEGVMAQPCPTKPMKVYDVVSPSLAIEGDLSNLISGKNYLFIDSVCSPRYFRGDFNGEFDMLCADSITLRVVTEFLSDSQKVILNHLLQSRANALCLGKHFTIQSEPELVDDLVNVLSGLSSTVSSTRQLRSLSEVFIKGDNEIWILVDDEFLIYHADKDRSIIRMAKGGLEPRTLLHELGHILGLPHRTKGCNICTDLQLHIMYDQVTIDTVVDQIMIQDWLKIIDECSGNSNCNTCFHIDKKPMSSMIGKSYNGQLRFLSDSILPSGRQSIYEFMNCFDCPVDSVNLSLVTPKHLKALCKSIPSRKVLLGKFTAEYNYYKPRYLNPSRKVLNSYLIEQVELRRDLYEERISVLVDTVSNVLIQRLPKSPIPRRSQTMQQRTDQKNLSQLNNFRGQLRRNLEPRKGDQQQPKPGN